MGVDGYIDKGAGVLINWVLLTLEQREAFAAEFSADVGTAVDGSAGVTWLTMLWAAPPRRLFGCHAEDKQRPDIFTKTTLQTIITPGNTSVEYHRAGRDPLVIRLRGDCTAIPRTADMLRDRAPAIAAIVSERGPAVLAGEWIVYRTD